VPAQPSPRALTRTRVPCQRRVRTHCTVERVGLENPCTDTNTGVRISVHPPRRTGRASVVVRDASEWKAMFFSRAGGRRTPPRTGSCGEEAWGRTSEPGRRARPSARATPAPGLYIPPISQPYRISTTRLAILSSSSPRPRRALPPFPRRCSPATPVTEPYHPLPFPP
jgi:hypothetical protein